ncbi:MAG: PDZ domain-containing protein [Planctomycetes bacterium]|nr:PDZ domain-containing protein [Planctomycetota bacterium]
MLFRSLPLSFFIICIISGALAAQPVRTHRSLKPNRQYAPAQGGIVITEEGDEGDEDGDEDDDDDNAPPKKASAVKVQGGSIMINGQKLKLENGKAGNVTTKVFTVPGGTWTSEPQIFEIDGENGVPQNLEFKMEKGQDGKMKIVQSGKSDLKVRKATAGGQPGQGGHGGPLLGVSVSSDGDETKISSIVPGSAAEKAGLQAGDILRSIDKNEIGSAEDVTKIIQSHKPGDALPIVVRRDGKKVKINATLGSNADASKMKHAEGDDAMVFSLGGGDATAPMKVHARAVPSAPGAPAMPHGVFGGMAGGAMAGGMGGAMKQAVPEMMQANMKQLRDEIAQLREQIAELKDLVKSLAQTRKQR